MCRFFSFIMNDKGKIFYFDKEQREKFLENNPNHYENDSHASICSYYGLDEDEVNKYEYLKELVEDHKCFDLNEEMQKKMDKFLSELNLKELICNSYNAYLFCQYVENDPEVRKYITTSYDAYHYCKEVENDPDVRKYITDSYNAYLFCKEVENDPDVRKLITESRDAYLYCKEVENDPDVRKYITDSYNAYLFCQYVENDPDVRKYITDKELLDELS